MSFGVVNELQSNRGIQEVPSALSRATRDSCRNPAWRRLSRDPESRSHVSRQNRAKCSTRGICASPSGGFSIVVVVTGSRENQFSLEWFNHEELGVQHR